MFQILKYPSSLKSFCLNIVVDKIDSKYLKPYETRLNDVTLENQPNFGPFGDLESNVLILIIEELVRREELKYEHLKILLPREAVSLTCDENTEFNPFQLDTIKLISKRCPDFQVLHYHYEREECMSCDREIPQEEILTINSTLTDAVILLKNLQEISLSDTPLEVQTIRVISTNCPNLNYLNLRQTDLSDEGLNCTCDEKSVIKDSLTTLIIDATPVTAISVLECLLILKNLKKFKSDRTIEACLLLYEDISNTKRSDTVPEFKSTIFKGKVSSCYVERLTPEFLIWLTDRFPKVKHLILFSLNIQVNTNLINMVTLWNCITYLELSSVNGRRDNHFNELKYALLSCKEKLISLKLDNIRNVDIFFLGNLFRKLEKLSFINCTFLSEEKNHPFESLRELKIVFLKYSFVTSNEEVLLDAMEMTHEDFIFILSSRTLEKVFIYDQSYFQCEVVNELIQIGSLRSLREIEVFFCPIKICGIKGLINEVFPIEKIVVGSCPLIRNKGAKEISNLIKEKNLTISFLIAKEIPYHLRWLVLDTENPVRD